MPTSWYQAIPSILDQVQKENPKSILDVGVGFGKYGLMVREVLELPYERYNKNQWIVNIEGIEAFEEYRNPIHDYIYNKIHYGEVTQVIDNLPKYDCILLIDVLEHFEKEEGKKVIDQLIAHTNKSLIISTPRYPSKQEEYLGNRYEEHKSKWSIIDFIDYDFSYQEVLIGGNSAELFQIFPTKKNISVEIKKEVKVDVDKTINKKDKLSIGYIIPHKFLTGGLKVLLYQMKELRSRGHKIHAIFRGRPNERALPDWFDIEVDKEILVPLDKSYLDYINDCDVIVCGFFNQILELETSDKPIVYLEQGSEILFGDYKDLSSNAGYRVDMKKAYLSNNCHLASISGTISRILKGRFDKESYIIPNFVDTDLYYPVEHEFTNTILLVGNPNLKFKDFGTAMQTLQNLWSKGVRFNVNWVCQTKPNVIGSSFPINFIENASQEKLAEYYRKADLFLFTSIYEGFGMPPLEAMASGTPVITTNCGGINEFVEPSYNALVAEVYDIGHLEILINHLLENKEARDVLSKRGRETALKFNKENTISKLEEYLLKIYNNN